MTHKFDIALTLDICTQHFWPWWIQEVFWLVNRDIMWPKKVMWHAADHVTRWSWSHGMVLVSAVVLVLKLFIAIFWDFSDKMYSEKWRHKIVSTAFHQLKLSSLPPALKPNIFMRFYFFLVKRARLGMVILHESVLLGRKPS